MSASVLSMDSPAFRPRAPGGGGGGGGTPSTNSTFANSPHTARNRAGSNGSGTGSNGEGYSNAVKSYSFETPDGYVFIYILCLCIAVKFVHNVLCYSFWCTPSVMLLLRICYLCIMCTCLFYVYI